MTNITNITNISNTSNIILISNITKNNVACSDSDIDDYINCSFLRITMIFRTIDAHAVHYV